MIRDEDISFIIVSFRSEKLLENTLKNLPPASKKIIIENSGNQNLKNFEKRFQNLESCIMTDNIGFGAANNIGIKKTTTRYVFLINPDTILEKDDFIKINDLCSNLNFAIIGFLSKDYKVNFPDGKDILSVNEVRGFAMLMDRNNLHDLYFDENFFLYLEEIDLCKRIISKNEKIFLLNITLNHLGGKSHGDKDIEIEKSRNWHWMWSKFYFSKKYRGNIISLIIFFPDLILLFFKFVLNIDKTKKTLFKMRIKGLLNSMIGKKSFYRPKVK